MDRVSPAQVGDAEGVFVARPVPRSYFAVDPTVWTKPPAYAVLRVTTQGIKNEPVHMGSCFQSTTISGGLDRHIPFGKGRVYAIGGRRVVIGH